MNLSQSFASFVGAEELARVFDGEELINLDLISNQSTALTKIAGDARPTYDSALLNISSESLYSKEGTSAAVFNRSDAEQIARSNSVLKGLLDKNKEFDNSITFENGIPELGVLVSFDDLSQILLPEFLVDIYYNNASDTAVNKYAVRNADVRMMTYNRTLDNVNDYYFGNEMFSSSQTTSSTYIPTAELLDIDASTQDTAIRVGDGTVGSGITLIADVPGLQNAVHLHEHLNALVELRLVFVREGKLLVGPIRSGLFKIDGATQTINKRENQNFIKLSLVKTWENITQVSGIRTSDSYLRSYSSNDGFFKNAASAEFYKTFKEDTD